MTDTQEKGRIEASGEHENQLVGVTENLIAEVSTFGWFQAGFIIVFQCVLFFSGPNQILYSFANLVPEAKCHDLNENVTNFCDVVSSCQNYTLEKPWGFASFPYEWPELAESVCNGSIDRISLTITLSSILGGLSFLVGGVLAGMVGRKPVILVSAILGTVLSFSLSYSTSFTMVMTLCCLSRMMIANLLQAQSLLSEYTLSKHRLTMSFSQTWGLVFPYLALLGYATKSWRTFVRYGSLFGIPLSLLVYLYPESPRWLIAERNYKRAAESLNKMAMVNRQKVRFTEQMIREKLSECTTTESERVYVSKLQSLKSIPKVFTHKRLGVLTFLALFQYMVNGITTTAIRYNMGDYSISPYLSTVFLGIVRIWTPFFFVGLDRFVPNFKRKSFLGLSFALVIIPFIIACVAIVCSVENIGDKGTAELTTTLAALFGCGMNTGVLWLALFQITAEMYPTLVRNGVVSLFELATNIGCAIGPYVMLLQNYWRPAHYILLIALQVACAVSAMMLLPETKGKPLPDSFIDLDLVF